MTYKDINIIYEDNHLLVVVKPQNIPSQEDSSGDKDMLTLLKEYLVESKNKPGNAFLGLVHRLDRPTGGVMVFAKTSKAAARLTESIQNGSFEKKYLAVVLGEIKQKQGRLDNYLMKYPKLNVVKVV
ncbi:MAG: RNA pseudouridine synthase, partial [Clostridia bacterium]|nr:RNA pseudouridine synthase [Clostridia bacterium]